MAEVWGYTTRGRVITTYERRNRHHSAGRPESTLESAAICDSPIANRTRAATALGNSRATVALNAKGKKEGRLSFGPSGSGDGRSDGADSEEEEGNLESRNLPQNHREFPFCRDSSCAYRWSRCPPVEPIASEPHQHTQTSSGTSVGPHLPPAQHAQTSTGSSVKTKKVQFAAEYGADHDSITSSNDNESRHVMGLSTRTFPRSATGLNKGEKKDVQTRSITNRGERRRYGKGMFTSYPKFWLG